MIFTNFLIISNGYIDNYKKRVIFLQRAIVHFSIKGVVFELSEFKKKRRKKSEKKNTKTLLKKKLKPKSGKIF